MGELKAVCLKIRTHSVKLLIIMIKSIVKYPQDSSLLLEIYLGYPKLSLHRRPQKNKMQAALAF